MLPWISLAFLVTHIASWLHIYSRRTCLLFEVDTDCGFHPLTTVHISTSISSVSQNSQAFHLNNSPFTNHYHKVDKNYTSASNLSLLLQLAMYSLLAFRFDRNQFSRLHNPQPYSVERNWRRLSIFLHTACVHSLTIVIILVNFILYVYSSTILLR